MNLTKYSSFVFVIICISVLTMTRAQPESPWSSPTTSNNTLDGFNATGTDFGRAPYNNEDDFSTAINKLKSSLDRSKGKSSKHMHQAMQQAFASSIAEIAVSEASGGSFREAANSSNEKLIEEINKKNDASSAAAAITAAPGGYGPGNYGGYGQVGYGGYGQGSSAAAGQVDYGGYGKSFLGPASSGYDKGGYGQGYSATAAAGGGGGYSQGAYGDKNSNGGNGK